MTASPSIQNQDLRTASVDLMTRLQAPTGAFPACPTFAVYRYSWLRDGTYIALALDTAGLAARNIRLKPGLVASAEIKTGGETIATYILRPVLKIGDESLREP